MKGRSYAFHGIEQLSRAMDDLDHKIRRELPFVADVFVDVTAYRAEENSRKGKKGKGSN